MSPPQFTMDKPVINEQDVEKRQKACSTKKLCLIAGITFVSLLIVAGTAFGAVAYNYHLFYKEDYDSDANVEGINLPEHIHVDYNKELIYVTNEQKGTIDALNALHNYDRKLLAFLDLTKHKCFIDRLDQTFDEGLKRWSSHAGKVRFLKKVDFDFPSEAIHPKILRKFAGDEIANHCKNVTSHWMLNIRPAEDTPREKRQVVARDNNNMEAATCCCQQHYFGQSVQLTTMAN